MSAPTKGNVPASADQSRLAGLDGVRGIAMLTVIVGHAGSVESSLGDLTWIDRLWTGVAHYCWAGLDIFFVLSGFLITGILLRNRGQPGYFKNFYARRVLRIMPIYYAFIVPMLFFAGRPPASDGLATAYLTYWHNLYFAWNGVLDDEARLVTWSLAVEEQFYLVWPAIVLLLPLRALRWFCAALIVGALTLRWYLCATVPDGDAVAQLQTTITVYMSTPCRVDALAAGALLATGLTVPPKVARGLCVAMVTFISFLIWRFGGLPVGHPIITIGCSANIVFSIGLIVLAMRGGLVERVCTSRLLQACGKYSYAMFLSHLLVIEWLRPLCWGEALPAVVRAVGFQLPACALFVAIVLTVAMTIGWLSWHFFEKRILSLKRFFPSR